MAKSRRDWPEIVISMQRQVEWLMADVVSRKPPMVSFVPKTWQPAIDVYETDMEVVVLVELAGIKEDEIEVTIFPRGQKRVFKSSGSMRLTEDNNILVVRGDRKDIKQGIKRTYSQMEILWGPFEREIVLPANVNVDQVRALYSDGFVEIVLPKQGKKKPHRVDVRGTNENQC